MKIGDLTPTEFDIIMMALRDYWRKHHHPGVGADPEEARQTDELREKLRAARPRRPAEVADQKVVADYVACVREQRASAKHTHIPGELYKPTECPGCRAEANAFLKGPAKR